VPQHTGWVPLSISLHATLYNSQILKKVSPLSPCALVTDT